VWKPVAWSVLGAAAGGALVWAWIGHQSKVDARMERLEAAVERLAAVPRMPESAMPASVAPPSEAPKPLGEDGPVRDPDNPDVFIDLHPTAPPAPDLIPAAYADGRASPGPTQRPANCETCGPQ
jgi:hypothetical protein